jgi:hypothetical protein
VAWLLGLPKGQKRFVRLRAYNVALNAQNRPDQLLVRAVSGQFRCQT